MRRKSLNSFILTPSRNWNPPPVQTLKQNANNLKLKKVSPIKQQVSTVYSVIFAKPRNGESSIGDKNHTKNYL
eukprot:15351531-Ditylum_brightwellii.AAC.1